MSARKATFGLILIALGFLLLLQSLDIMSMSDFAGYILPLALIGFGIWLIVRKKQEIDTWKQTRSDEYRGSGPYHSPPPPPPPGGQTTWNQGRPQPPPGEQTQPREEPLHDAGPKPGAQTGPQAEPKVSAAPSGDSAEGKLRYEKFLGDLFVDLEGRDVRDVEASLVIGDVEIKLHGSRLGQGLNRMVISSFVGDIRVLVPRDMEVFAHCSNFIGDIDLLGQHTSGFSNNLDGQTPGYPTAENRLYIAANNFLGDIKIYYV